MNKKALINQLRRQKFPEKILKAFEEVERGGYVLSEYLKQAYEDTALPIGHRQTISQPYTIAFMLMLLEVRDNQKILEVGSGSGYVLELLAHLNPNGIIYGIERIKEFAGSSKIKVEHHKNINVINADGSKGLKEKAPFDRILVSASCDEIPQKLVAQLKTGGILVAPVRDSIIILKKEANENKIKEYPGFIFVPLVEG